MSIVAELPGSLQVLSDGSVKRFAREVVPASEEPINGYKSKDVIIDTSKPITGRLFLSIGSSSSDQNKLLPVTVHFHGGGFCNGSAKWVGYHNFLGDLCTSSQSIILSVDYLLAPENRLPIAYENCYSSLDWLAHQVISDPWLKQADLSRVFLSGDSAGGNIVHNVAIKAIQNNNCSVKIKGLLPVHPYFGSEEKTEEEKSKDFASFDLCWTLSLPEGSNRDYYGCNFEKAELSADEWSHFPAVMVFVAGLDLLKERGVMYAEFLQKKGVKVVRLVEAEGETHCFHVRNPKSDVIRLLQQQMSDFIKTLE